MKISQDLQHRPIIFICFNPYIDHNGKIIKYYWKLNKLGLIKIVKVRE
jgi:hypothetical protein